MTARNRQHPLRPLAALSAGALLVAGCSVDSLLERGLSQVEGVDGVAIDRESGSFSIRGEEGEVMSVEIDEESGTSTFTTEEGTVTTGQADELPPEIAALFSPPPGFAPQAVSDLTEADTRGLMVQGSIEGDWDDLMDSIEAAVEAGPWDEVQRQAVVPGVMGAVIGLQEGDPGTNLNVSLLMEEDGTEGLLSIVLVLPTPE